MDLEDANLLKKEALEKIQGVKTTEELESLRVEYLGRKDGAITKLLRSLGDMSIEEKRAMGPVIQEAKTEIESLIKEKEIELGESASVSPIDHTAPGFRLSRGHLHPLTLAYRDMCRIFRGLNFSIVEGPEVETEYYNFDALNFPPAHPAREMQDTFWMKSAIRLAKGMPKRNSMPERLLPRTHASNVQVRYAESHEPPFQIFYPGRCFRYEPTDAGHEVNFYQAEAMVVSKMATLTNFKFVVEEFFRQFFAGQSIDFRYRPSFFPFTEPSLEIDIKLRGKWFEVMGAGMVHPRVFEHAELDPKKWRGYAFGMGLDRLAMIRYQITDIRLLYSGDLRFIRQFS